MPGSDDLLLTLVDPDKERRAAITSFLRPFEKHVEPHGELDRLISNWPLKGMLLVHDSGALVADLQAAMQTRGIWRSHVAYDEAASTGRVVDAVFGGAIDYIDWPLGQEELLSRMELWPSRSAQTGPRHRRKNRARKRLALLTRREVQVLKLMIAGKAGQQVADILQISGRTAEIHRAHLKKKLGVSSNGMAVRLAIESELWPNVRIDGP
jgi:two-component system response regulator FixJ